MALAALAAVCTVVAMTGLVRAASERILAAVTDMGANRITVLGTAGLEMEGGWRNVERIDLTMDDVARIESHIDNVDRVSLSILRSLPLRREHRILEQVVVHAVVGPPHRTRTIGDAVWDVELGVALTSDDNEHRRQAIVIGPTVREALFDPDEDPLGAYVLVGEVPFGVKGVLGPFPTADLYGPDLFEDEEWLAGLGAVAYLAAPAIADHLDLPLAIPPWAVPAALTTSLAVGAVFGTVPAWRAARVDPMASLTTE